MDERPGYLSAEQTFGSVEQVPPLLAHTEGEADEGRPVLDRSRIELTNDDLVVLRRFTYRETRGDPYGIEELNAALDALKVEAIDSDTDGQSDFDELAAGGDPNQAAGAVELVPPPQYGCSSAAGFGVLAPLIGLLWRSARRQRTRFRPRVVSPLPRRL